MNDNYVHEMVISEDIVFYDDHNVYAKTQGASLPFRNQLHEGAHYFDNQMMVKVYGKDGIHSHTLYVDWRGEHSNITNRNKSHDYNDKVLMQILNKKVHYEGNWVDVVHIMGGSDQITGYYLLLADDFGFDCNMICYAHPPEGYLEVLRTINCEIIKVLNVANQMDLGSSVIQNLKLTYDNYCKDQQVWQYYQCDYVTYMTKIIDALIENDNQKITDYDLNHDNDLGEQITQQDSPKGITLHENESKELSDGKTKNFSVITSQARDFNYPDKKVGYLTQVQTNFKFKSRQGTS